MGNPVFPQSDIDDREEGEFLSDKEEGIEVCEQSVRFF